MAKRGSAQPNPIDVIEAAYELERNNRDWLHHLTVAIAPLLEGGCGVTAYTFDLATPMETWLQNEILVDFPRSRLAAQRAFQLSHSPGESEAMHVYPEALGGLADTLRKAGLGDLQADPIVGEHFRKMGVRDYAAFRTIEAGSRGICINAQQRELRHYDRRTLALWARVAAHVAAARRLRETLRKEPKKDAGVEAVLTPSGKVEHAEGEGTSRSAREALREAVVRAEAARGRLRRLDPERATEAWAALVSGRWSIVDRYERGGKRYLIARRNEHDLPDPRALSPRERVVVHLALLGKSNRLIAYELGISISGVATHLSSGMRKLGVTRRVDLIRLARKLVR